MDLFKKHLKEKRNFRIIYDGEDFGVYRYSNLNKRYEGESEHQIGYLDIKSMLEVIEGEIDFIKLEMVKEDENEEI